jgi:hypothetical protein
VPGISGISPVDLPFALEGSFIDPFHLEQITDFHAKAMLSQHENGLERDQMC